MRAAVQEKIKEAKGGEERSVSVETTGKEKME